MLSSAQPSAQYLAFIFVMSSTVNGLNKQHNNKTRNVVEVNISRIVGITHTYE
jgi:hypothetical protein